MKLIQLPVSPASPTEGYDGNEPPHGYAMAWKTQWEDSDVPQPLECPPTTLWHFGTNFVFNSCIYLDSKRDILAVVGSNTGSMVTRLGIRTALESVIQAIDEGQENK